MRRGVHANHPASAVLLLLALAPVAVTTQEAAETEPSWSAPGPVLRTMCCTPGQLPSIGA